MFLRSQNHYGFDVLVFVNGNLLLVSVLLGLLLVEGIMRLTFPSSSWNEEKLKVNVHESSNNVGLRYKLAPNTSNYAHGVLNRINSQGFRDREHLLEKEEGVKRVIFLGDSVVYGHGIEMDEAVPDQPERIYETKEDFGLKSAISYYDRITRHLYMGISQNAIGPAGMTRVRHTASSRIRF